MGWMETFPNRDRWFGPADSCRGGDDRFLSGVAANGPPASPARAAISEPQRRGAGGDGADERLRG